MKRSNSNGSKNNAPVKIPAQLNISGHSITPGNHFYELYGVVEHSGTARGGHYVAYTRRGHFWYYFSDSQFYQTSWDKVKKSQPYILFFKKVDQKEL